MQTILIVDESSTASQAFLHLFERPGRELLLCNDVELAEIVVERSRPAHVVTVLGPAAPFGDDGLRFLSFVKRCAPETGVVVITGADGEKLEHEALLRGADAVLRRPFTRSALDAHVPPPAPGDDTPMAIHQVPSIDEVLESDRLVPHYQPILDLTTHAVYGFESLARFRDGVLSDPAALFEFAKRKGRLMDLELVCLRASFARGSTLVAGAKLFLNVHPSVIRCELLGEALTSAAAAAGVAPRQTVLEITEQGSLGDSATVQRRCDDLRARGFVFAIDDIGMAFSHLAHIDRIQPRYLKISPEFGVSFEGDVTRRKIVKHALSLARDFGCELILEGIESLETCSAAHELGVPLGQGFFFHRPMAAERFVDRPISAGTCGRRS